MLIEINLNSTVGNGLAGRILILEVKRKSWGKKNWADFSIGVIERWLGNADRVIETVGLILRSQTEVLGVPGNIEVVKDKIAIILAVGNGKGLGTV